MTAVSFGSLARRVSARLPALDVPILVVDESDAAAALIEATRRRAHGLPFAALVLVDDDVATDLRRLSPLVLSGTSIADERRRMFEGAVTGTLTINGRPHTEMLARDRVARRALGCIMRLADILLVRSRQELLRLSHACQQEPQQARLIEMCDDRVPPVSLERPGKRLVLWAPDARAIELGMLWAALEFFHLPTTVICADGHDIACLAPVLAGQGPAARGRWTAVSVDGAAEALADARLVVDATTSDPSSARALARLGIPLVAAASSGVDEWVDGAILYQLSQYGSIVMAPAPAMAEPAQPRALPRVSVVVPTRNRPRLLRRALASVRRQRWPAVEVVVVNDAGDDVSDVVAAFPQARLITHPEPRGVSATRNTALDAARGEYVAFLDDDDIYLPDHLQRAVEALESHQGDFVSAANIAVFVDRGDEGALSVHSAYVYDGVYNGLVMNVWQPVLVQSIVGRASLMADIRFDQTLAVAEDFEFLMRLGQRGEFGYLLRPTWMITVYSEQGSLSTSDRYADALRRIYARYPVTHAPSLVAQREAQVKRYDELGGCKEPWTPPLGRLPLRVALEDVDGLGFEACR